jgi:integrase/recombinase XerC
MIKSFIQYLLTEKRFSQHTVDAYSTDINQFAEYLEITFEIDDLHEVTDKMIRSWMVHLSDQGLLPRSINRKLSSLKSLYKFELKSGKIIVNPAANINGPKTKKRLPSFVEEKEMQFLFEKLDFEDSFKGFRDKLILDLFYQTGMRLSELRNIKVIDIDFSKKMLKVLGKRNKERLIPLHDHTLLLISNYILLRSKEVKSSQHFLILNNKGEQAGKKFVYRCVNSYLSKVTDNTKKSPHVIRHTFATHMLNRGADLNTIKELLGHANLAATQIYTHNSINKLKTVYKLAHPKGQK